MKKLLINKLFGLFELVNPYFFGLIIYLFKVLNQFRKRPNILVFTDSRGFEVTKFWNRKNPFSSYIGKLICNYSCTVKVCPEKFTSLLDFLEFYRSVKTDNFELVILHCGIVDFAPRPELSFDQMYKSKLHLIDKYYLSNYIDKNKRKPGEKYQGEDTYSFINKNALVNIVLPEMLMIPNLIYIGINPVLPDWDGNYWRKRPKNINEQLVLDEMLCQKINNSICLSDLNSEQIRSFTSDNVHYTKAGFNFIYQQLKPKLPSY